MRLAFVCLLLCACSSSPRLLDAPVDAGAADGGCDVDAWAASCGAGLVCASDTCGPPCGNGNVVCDPGTVCDSTSDCVPPCSVAPPPLRPGQSCLGAGYLQPADATQPCILPCWYAFCGFLGGGCFNGR